MEQGWMEQEWMEQGWMEQEWMEQEQGWIRGGTGVVAVLPQAGTASTLKTTGGQ
jgi:hypothetical protein